MILVTGTKRSGTSLWMQILIAAGFPAIGRDYLGRWDASIRDANPRGFWESALRRGVYYATNPDPRTGQFLFPQQTRRHAVKVFIPGLVRTDYAYLDRVVATLRPWREYCASLARLYAMEDRFLADLPPEEGPDGAVAQPLERAQAGRAPLPAAIEWWFENYDLVRDIATRRYPVNLLSYHRLVEDPGAVLPPVLAWLGGDVDVAAAVAAVDPGLRTQAGGAAGEGVEPAWEAVFDALHGEIYERQRLPRSLLDQLNETNRSIEAAYPRPPLLA